MVNYIILLASSVAFWQISKHIYAKRLFNIKRVKKFMTFSNFYRYYQTMHRDPMNRLFHFMAIQMVSLLCFHNYDFILQFVPALFVGLGIHNL